MATRQKRIQLHRAQAAFRKSDALYRAFVGGRGAGKSWVGAYDLIRRAKRRRTYLVGSPTGILLGDTTFPTFKALAQDLGVWGEVRLTPYPNVRLTTGAEVRFRTAEDPERLRGPNLSGVWLDEASLMRAEAYSISIACLREQGEQGWMSLTFTPKGITHWTYEHFARLGTDGKPLRPDTALFHARTGENPFLPADFAERLTEQYAGRYALQEIDGQFVAMEGADWPADYFGPHLFFDDWPPDLTARVLALDPSKGKQDKSGDYSAFVLLGMDRARNLWVDADLSNTRPVEPLQSAPGASSIVEDGIALYQRFDPQAFAVETNGFQEWVARAFQRAAAAKGITLPLYTITSSEPKVIRIRTLGPFLAQRRIRVRNTPGGRMLVAQLRDFPLAQHDDGPDALHMALTMLNKLMGKQTKRGPELLRG